MKKKVMGYDKGGKMPLPKKKPRYANPNHPMNAERTTGHPDGVTRKTKGGKVKTVAAKSGGDMKTVPAGNKGLAKLPTEVRNRMGYAKKGGSVKAAKHGGPMCRGGGAATRGTKFKAT